MRFHRIKTLVEFGPVYASKINESSIDDFVVQSEYYGDFSIDYSPIADKWVLRKSLEYVDQFDDRETAIDEAKKRSGKPQENDEPGDPVQVMDYQSPVSNLGGAPVDMGSTASSIPGPMGAPSSPAPPEQPSMPPSAPPPSMPPPAAPPAIPTSTAPPAASGAPGGAPPTA